MTTKKDSEVEVMGEAHGALSKLKETQAQCRVIRWLVDRLNLSADLPDLFQDKGAPNGKVSGSAKQSPGKPPDAKRFLTQKRPLDFQERMACLAYYTGHYLDTSRFKTKDLTKLNNDAAQPKLSNPSVFASNAVKAQFLASAGGGKKQITARGEAVVEALPDREAVKRALEQHPLVGRKGKAGKKTRKKKAKAS